MAIVIADAAALGIREHGARSVSLKILEHSKMSAESTNVCFNAAVALLNDFPASPAVAGITRSDVEMAVRLLHSASTHTAEFMTALSQEAMGGTKGIHRRPLEELIIVSEDAINVAHTLCATHLLFDITKSLAERGPGFAQAAAAAKTNSIRRNVAFAAGKPPPQR